MKNIVYSLFFVVPLVAISCYVSSHTSFVKATNVVWSSIQIRDGLDYDMAWGEVLDVVAKKFEMEMISKEGGYGRSAWIYTWNTDGVYNENYRVRVIFKFSADHSKVDIKTDAEKRIGDNWYTGYDTRLLKTIKTDVMGVVGRTTL
ncbi:MAG: hypothetical protein EOL95_10015 [Bacteroidia bacterium]|nr:hypothetical protein [Bacteroidia bacterium]